jgi:hypothetical protein
MIRPVLGVVALVVASFVPIRAAAADLPAAVLDPYLKLQTALAADSLPDAQAAARTLVEQAGRLGPALKIAGVAAGKVAGAVDITAARAAFGDLSDAMLALTGGETGGAGVRIAYCPMAKKSWLQKGTEITNPYYGSQMLRCGEFRK